MAKTKLDTQSQKVIVDAFRAIAGPDRAVAAKASMDIIQAVQTPLRQAILPGSTIAPIFSPETYAPGERPEYPIDFLTPGLEGEHYAYVTSNHGYVPMRRVEGDYLTIPTYKIQSSIDMTLRYLRNANWNVVARAMEVLESGFVKKMNDDGWQTVLAAGLDRNLVINDDDAAVGQFTPRLITLLNIFMRRNGGGNSGSTGRSKLTDLFVSPEAHMDIRSWGLDLIPDAARERIYFGSEDSQDMINIYGVNLHALDELGEDQDYQQYYATTLGGAMAATDVEVVIGIDRQRDDSFIHPIAEPVSLFEDPTAHRQGLWSTYGWSDIGFAVLDTRRVLLGSL
jgi:hypothetical protein